MLYSYTRYTVPLGINLSHQTNMHSLILRMHANKISRFKLGPDRE